jgi:hypothetical protein
MSRRGGAFCVGGVLHLVLQIAANPVDVLGDRSGGVLDIARHFIDFAAQFIEAALDLCLGQIGGAAKIAHASSHRAHHLGQFFRPDKDEQQQDDHHQFGTADAKHVASFRRHWAASLRGRRQQSAHNP